MSRLDRTSRPPGRSSRRRYLHYLVGARLGSTPGAEPCVVRYFSWRSAVAELGNYVGSIQLGELHILRRQPRQVTWERCRQPDIGHTGKLHQQSFQADSEAAVDWHTVA